MIKRTLTAIFLFALWVGLLLPLQGQTLYPKRPAEDQSEAIIRQKAFYLLDVLLKEPWDKRLAEDAVLNDFGAAYTRRVKHALQSCADASCLSKALQWKTSEIRQVGRRLKTLYRTDSHFQGLTEALRGAHRYQTSNGLSDTAFIREAWEQCAQGLNHVIGVYLGGVPPLYPAIDSISFNIQEPSYTQHARTVLTRSVALKTPEPLFFELFLRLAMDILNMNGRDEAARYEPLTGGLNRSAYKRVETIDWARYPYSALLVPGFGPETADQRIDYRSVARCKRAVKVFQEGKAPFIIVSGGHVYPHKTPFSEAVEMRRYLIDTLGIAEENIIIEPHARHTTTNIRNVARLIYRMGMPADKPVLVVTDLAQQEMIEHMDDRCMRELGYLPYKHVRTIRANQIEFYPIIEVFEANEMDVLDP